MSVTGYIISGDEKEACVGGFVGSGYSAKDWINEVSINYTSGGKYVGGIMGVASGNMSNVENKANITGADYVGGIWLYEYFL